MRIFNSESFLQFRFCVKNIKKHLTSIQLETFPFSPKICLNQFTKLFSPFNVSTVKTRTGLTVRQISLDAILFIIMHGKRKSLSRHPLRYQTQSKIFRVDLIERLRIIRRRNCRILNIEDNVSICSITKRSLPFCVSLFRHNLFPII